MIATASVLKSVALERPREWNGEERPRVLQVRDRHHGDDAREEFPPRLIERPCLITHLHDAGAPRMR